MTSENYAGYRLSDSADPGDFPDIMSFLADTYWAGQRRPETQARAMANSLNACAHHGEELVAYARVVSDYATFAYLCDVYVAPDHRGQGLAQAMLAFLGRHPELRGLRRWLLATRDAHGLYDKAGWTLLARPEIWMERFQADAEPPILSPSNLEMLS